jgi:hypothetical protein
VPRTELQASAVPCLLGLPRAEAQACHLHARPRRYSQCFTASTFATSLKAARTGRSRRRLGRMPVPSLPLGPCTDRHLPANSDQNHIHATWDRRGHADAARCQGPLKINQASPINCQGSTPVTSPKGIESMPSLPVYSQTRDYADVLSKHLQRGLVPPPGGDGIYFAKLNAPLTRSQGNAVIGSDVVYAPPFDLMIVKEGFVMSIDLLHLSLVVSVVSGLLRGGWMAARWLRRRPVVVVARSWMVDITIAATARRVALSSLTPGNSKAELEHAQKLIDTLLRLGLPTLPDTASETHSKRIEATVSPDTSQAETQAFHRIKMHNPGLPTSPSGSDSAPRIIETSTDRSPRRKRRRRPNRPQRAP